MPINPENFVSIALGIKGKKGAIIHTAALSTGEYLHHVPGSRSLQLHWGAFSYNDHYSELLQYTEITEMLAVNCSVII